MNIMRNTLYSSKIQGILQLDLSREYRFRDDRKDAVLGALGLKPGMTVLDAGCGPGSLTRKLATWLGPASHILGMDRDTTFIEYARKKAEEQRIKNIEFLEGNVLAMPLEDNYVDVCTSHTVIEHVPNTEFLLEQKRVCRPGGRVSVMMAQPKSYIHSDPDSSPKISERERELWVPINAFQRNVHTENKTGSYDPEPHALPSLFEDLGFVDIQVDAVALPVVPDDSRNDSEEKRAILETQQLIALEDLERALPFLPKALSEDHVRELKELITERYSKRLAILETGTHVWDYYIGMVLVVSGIA
jgi:ubiquinone/menaquinone biosynthesis C-methylase UbiE